MKKPTGRLTKKLTMNRETIRTLAGIELVHVAAGIGEDTGDTNCVHVNAVKPPTGG